MIVRRYEVAAPGRVDEAVERVRSELVPRFERAEGFVAYYLTVDGDAVCTVSVFEHHEAAEEAHGAVGQWVRENFTGLFAGAPQVTAGEVLVSSPGP